VDALYRNVCYPCVAMQIIPAESTRRGVRPDDRIRISAESLTESQVEAIRRFLEEDPRIESVEVGPLATFIEPPRRSNAQSKGDEHQFLTFEICASSEIGALIINFLENNKDTIGTVSSLVGMGTPVLLGGNYVLRKLREFCSNRKAKFTKIPIYDPKGNVITWVRRKGGQLH
jgi:hypothetical protein